MLFVVEVKNVVVLEIIPCDLVEQKQVVQVFPTMCQFLQAPGVLDGIKKDRVLVV